jgi:hypothetical protein
MKKNQVTIPVAVQCLAKALREDTEFYNKWRNELVECFQRNDNSNLDKKQFLTLGIKNFLDLLSSIK